MGKAVGREAPKLAPIRAVSTPTPHEHRADAVAARHPVLGGERPLATPPQGAPLPPAFWASVLHPERVRLHSNGEASARASQHHALAITQGDDIYLGARAARSGHAFSRLLVHELAHVAQTRVDPRLAHSTLTKRDPAEERAIAVDKVKSTMIDAFHGPEALKTTAVDMMVAAARHLADDANSGGPLTARTAARALLAIYDELQRRAKSAPRAEDGALLARPMFGSELLPWTADRVRMVEQIPNLDPANLSRWIELANSEDPYAAPVEGTIRRRRVEKNPDGTQQTYAVYRLDNKKLDPDTPVIYYDEHTVIKTKGMSFSTPEGRAIIYAKIIRRVDRIWHREALHTEPRYTVQEEMEQDAKALEIARKIAVKYKPPADKTTQQYEAEFEKRPEGSMFTVEVWPSFYAELNEHGVTVPDSLMYSWMRKKRENAATTSLWRPMLPSASLEERLTFAWKQVQFAQKHAAAHRYTPGNVSKNGLMFLYQATGEDMVYLFPDGRIMVVNERALMLEAFRQGVLAAAGAVMLGYVMIALAVAVAAAPLALEFIAAAPAAAQSAYLWALTNPMQALVLAEFAAGTSLTILDIGFDGFLESLKTPQGAAMLFMEILTFRAAGGNRPHMPRTPPTPSTPRLPTIPRRPAGNFIHIDIDAPPRSTVPPRRGPTVGEPDPAPTPRPRAPGAVEPEPTPAPKPTARRPDLIEPEPPPTPAKRPGGLDPDEGMHEGKATYGKPVDVDIAGDPHELIVSKEKDGKPRVRLCSKSCDYVVDQLDAARDQLDDTPKNAPARARIQALIDEGRQIDAEFGTRADRQARQDWPDTLKAYKDRLRAAAKVHPEIGDALKDVLKSRKPLLQPGDEGYTGTLKPRSWKLAPTPDGMGAHMFERSNVKGRPAMARLDTDDTPRYYPRGSKENAGQAHLRIHDASSSQGIPLGGAPVTDKAIIDSYKAAYKNANLNGIKGDLKQRDGTVIKPNVTPGEAFDALLEWAGIQ